MQAINKAPTSHGGLLIPLDMFRVSHLAAVASELLVSKARNIVDAKLVLVRHPASQIVLGRIEGSVIGDDAMSFWRENADIALAASQVLPRQCLLYYAKTAPAAERREGLVVAQRGQIVTADDATPERGPNEHWPVTKLCEQLRVGMGDLAEGFPGGPRIEVSLMEPAIDDQQALMILAGRQGAAAGEGAEAPDAAGPAAAPAGAPAARKRDSMEDDAKRREKERQAESAEKQRRAQEIKSAIAFEIDELGVIVSPAAELSEADLLARYIQGRIVGDLPEGLPSKHADALQGKRCDIAIRVDFLSEVFVENAPLTKAMLEERGVASTVEGRAVRRLEVLAPRLGYGTLVTTGKAPHVFVSRKPELPQPDGLVAKLLTAP
jgi:hypothetical protein